MDYGQVGNHTEWMTFQFSQKKKTAEKQQIHKLAFTEKTLHKHIVLNNKIYDWSKEKK